MAIVALNKQALGYRSRNYWLLLLSIDLATFYDVSSTRGFHLNLFRSLTSSHILSCLYHGFPPLPTNQPYVSTCGIDEKLSKATHWRVHELKYLWWLYNWGELHGSSSMHSWDIILWIIELYISKYLSLCVIGGFSKIQSHICIKATSKNKTNIELWPIGCSFPHVICR